jgi:hypothetical protein
MDLNEKLQWEALPVDVQNAFQTRISKPEKVLLEPGMVIYKLNDFNTLHPVGNKAISPWWSPYQEYRHDSGFENRVKIAEASGVSIQEWIRLTSAIKENWNSLKYLLVVELKVPVYGFFSGFSSMPRLDVKQQSKRLDFERASSISQSLPGGSTQFYIPNLDADMVNIVRFEELKN